MKFNLGEWRLKPGVTVMNAEQIRETRVSDDKKSLWLFAVGYRQDVRSMDGPAQEITITSPQEGVIRLQSVHFKGDRRSYPKFDLNIDEVPMEIVEDAETVSCASGDMKLVVHKKNPCAFTYFYKNEPITNIGERFGTPMLSAISTPEGHFMRAQLQVDVGEKIYGLGERFTPFVRNGQTIDIWNEDGGTSSEIAYKNIPFYITNKNYGVLVNDAGPVSFEVCTEAVTKVQFSVPGERMDFMVFAAETRKDVLKSYTRMSGRPALPPAWSFGLWLSSSFTTSYDEKTVLSFVDGMASCGIPLSVFHFDCFWMRENEWCGFDWDERVFPDVEGLIKKLHERGLKVCVWINPYIGQKSRCFDECADKGYLLKKENGDIWQWELWQAGCSVVDFTNPDAVEWYKSKLKKLMAQGVDAFKTDFGERIPTDVRYHNGMDAVRMHNYYTYLYNKTVFETIAETRGREEACVFARSATVGGQKFPVHWGGDCNSTYVSMAESLRAGLGFGLSGFGFWSHDMGGFEGTAPAHVYKRWLAFGLLSSHSRLHGSDSYRVPWLFGEEAVDVCRYFAKLKNKLMPYLYAKAVETSETGLPMMRAMMLEFDEIGCEDLDKQYMLGDSLLVAPVLKENGWVDFYLPKGRWTHLLSGETVEGNGWTREKYDFFSLPLFVRENTILPIGYRDDATVYDYAKELTLRLYHINNSASARIVDAHGDTVLTVSAKRDGNQIVLNVSDKTIHFEIEQIGTNCEITILEEQPC